MLNKCAMRTTCSVPCGRRQALARPDREKQASPRSRKRAVRGEACGEAGHSHARCRSQIRKAVIQAHKKPTAKRHSIGSYGVFFQQ